MVEKISRRSFLKLVGATGGAVILAGCTEGDGGSRGFLDRLRGIPITQLTMIEGAWEYSEGVHMLEMTKLPELEEVGGAVRIEGETLSVLSGPANGSLTSYPLELADGKLKISLD